MKEAVPRAFDKIAREYDNWYEDNPLFESELKALASISKGTPKSLEVGVGSGRFSQALGIGIGLDAAFRPLKIAASRGISPVQGEAETLPFKDEVLEQVFLILTLCFLGDRRRALKEAHRVLIPGGRLVLGFIPKDSTWGSYYREKAEAGHVIYRHASFFTPDALLSLLRETGFAPGESMCTLFQPPGEQNPKTEEPKPGIESEAGFVVIMAQKVSTMA